MTLPASGTITTAQISQEIYGNTTTSITIPDATTRTLTGKASGDLILPNDFWGKTWASSKTHVMTAANFGSNTGYFKGTAGSVSAAVFLTPPSTAEVVGLYETSGPSLTMVVAGNYTVATLPMTQLQVKPTASGTYNTYNKASASRSFDGVNSSFTWSIGSFMFSAGGTYNAVYT